MPPLSAAEINTLRSNQDRKIQGDETLVEQVAAGEEGDSLREILEAFWANLRAPGFADPRREHKRTEDFRLAYETLYDLSEEESGDGAPGVDDNPPSPWVLVAPVVSELTFGYLDGIMEEGVQGQDDYFRAENEGRGAVHRLAAVLRQELVHATLSAQAWGPKPLLSPTELAELESKGRQRALEELDRADISAVVKAAVVAAYYYVPPESDEI